MPKHTALDNAGMKLKRAETLKVVEDHSCRVCLRRSSGDMEFLFPINDERVVVSLAEQINQCSEIPLITRNDGFAQYICGACKAMLEVAQRFRELCKKSDEEMRTIQPQKELIREFKAENAESPLQEEDSTFVVENHSDSENVCENDDLRSTSLRTRFNSKRKKRACKYRCEHCDQSFTAAKNLKSHLRTHLPPKIWYPCSKCKKTFRQESCLVVHMKTHTSERPFVCETCGKVFKSKLNLQYHQDRHENIRKYACSQCPFRAVQKFDLKIHERSHTGDKPYECPECLKTFSTSSNRLVHIRSTHERIKHKCDVCEQLFASREGCRSHMIVHSGLKRFQCQHCPSVYVHMRGLRRHMKELHPEFRTPGLGFFSDQSSSTKNRLGDI